MRRRFFLLGLTLAAVMPSAGAQQLRKMKRMAMLSPAAKIGDMTASSKNSYFRSFFEELSRRRYVEGQNIIVERYSANGETARYPQVAADIVSTHPDVIFASGTPVAVQLKKITQSIPIVSVSADPIALGLVSSLARPGGNLTGASIDAGLELHGKRFQLLTEMIPSLSKIYYLASAGYWEREAGIAARSAARRVGIPVIELPLGRTVSQRAYEEVLLSLQPGERSALLVSDEGEHLPLRQSLVDLIAARHLPACYPFREFVEAGGLMSYSVDLADLFRLMAAQVSDILEGKKPSEIPVYQPTKFELAINARAAKALNLDLSPSFLAQADHVLE